MTANISTGIGIYGVKVERIEKIDDREYFLHRNGPEDIDGWKVSEWESGHLVACLYDEESDPEEVLNLARERIQKAGPDQLNQLITTAIKEWGQANAPREAVTP